MKKQLDLQGAMIREMQKNQNHFNKNSDIKN